MKRDEFNKPEPRPGILDALLKDAPKHAGREVLMCAGSLETPKLLMLSGIGPGEELRRVGVEVVHEAPGVG